MKRIYFPMALGICLIVCFSLFLYTVHAWALYNIPTYIELNFDDIEYNYAQYIKFTIESDGDGYDYKIVLYMRSNNGVTFTITYKISELAETGELNDENSDTLTIYLHADEFEGKKVTFDSFDYDPNLSFTRYVALWGEKGGEQDYSGGEAELRKILIYGYGFKLYYIALDGDGDFSDPSWKIDVSEEDWDNEKEFKDDGHTYTTATSIGFRDTYIHVTENPLANDPLANYSWAYPSSIYGYFPFQYAYGYGQPSGYGLPYGYGPTIPRGPNRYSDINGGLLYQFFQPVNWLWTDPFTAYSPNQNQMAFVNPGPVWQSPYFQQTGYNPYVYGYQQTYNPYGSGVGYGLSPEDQAIMAAGGVPSWFEMPDWEERRPYRYGLPYGGYAGYVQSPPPPGYYGYPVPWED